MDSVFLFLEQQPVLFLFMLISIGMTFGHIKIRGVRLGAAAVLFSALALAALAQHSGFTLRVTPQLGILGLALFAFAIGVSSGASFFQNLRRALGPILVMVAFLLLSAGIGMVIGKAFNMSPALIMGSFSGAVTNTPALAAAGGASGDLASATVGYSITYLFGVIAMLVASMAALSYGKRDRDTPAPIENKTIRVERTDGPQVEDISLKYGNKIKFSRLQREDSDSVKIPLFSDILNKNDLVTVVGPASLLKNLGEDLGHASSHSLLEDRSHLDFRRITVSDPHLTGKSIEDLKIGERYHASISRVRRGDIDITADPSLRLLQGDRVRIVAPKARMKEISNFFGDSARGLTDLNPIALGLGMALGILLGELPVLTPTGGYLTIGSAAGTLVVGLVFGSVRRIGPLVTAIPQTATHVLSELGMLIFLAQAGAVAGGQIDQAFSSGSWWKILLLGIVMTSILAIGMFVSMRWVFHMGGTRLAGVLAGTQTQPAVLAFANERTNADPRVALGYALVYPVAMIAKILISQIGATF